MFLEERTCRKAYAWLGTRGHCPVLLRACFRMFDPRQHSCGVFSCIDAEVIRSTCAFEHVFEFFWDT